MTVYLIVGNQLLKIKKLQQQQQEENFKTEMKCLKSSNSMINHLKLINS